MKKKQLYDCLLCGFFFIVLSNCFYFVDSMRKAETALKKGDCEKARKFFISSPNKKLKFAKKAGNFCLSSSPKTAVWFYHYLSERENINKIFSYKKKIADIYFEILKDYEKAIEAYSFLSDQNLSKKERNFYVYRMAFSYFELGKFSVALSLLNKGTSSSAFDWQISSSDRIYWDNKFLMGRAFLMLEQYVEAEQIFQEIQQKNPLYFKENKLFYYLSFIYELQKEFHQAISELEQFESTSEFLTSKIRRLRVRQGNQPGMSNHIGVRIKH